MNFFGTYHTDIRPQAMGICDAPQFSKGRMTFSSFETATAPDCMALTYGRLQNRAALVRALQCAPYASQAQLLLQAYAAWGDDFVHHVEGPCLCCIADIGRDRMLVVRDKMGEIPLFYAHKRDEFVFADHPDMILRSGFVEPIAGREELCQLFALGPARTPGRTPVRGVMSLPAGHMLICEKEGLEKKCYWSLSVQAHDEDEETTVQHTRHLLDQCVDDAVRFHPACMLSGGIDSTALTALLSMRIGRLQSFSVDYRNNDADFVANDFRPEMDEPYIRQAVRILGTQHHRVILEQEALADALFAAMRARGFPGMSDIDASLLLFARSIVRNAPSVVSGECGDEVFGGYPWFREGAVMPEDHFPWSGSIELREQILRPEVREKLQIRRFIQEKMHASLESYDVSGAPKEEQPLFRLQRLCFDYFMPNLQERAVQMCAACALNVLTPLCDARLVEYVYSVPWGMKRMNGVEKGLLRAAVGDLLPDPLRMRKKSPYPKTCSAVYTSMIRGRMRALCADPDAPLWKLVDMNAVDKIASSGMDPAETPWFGQLMAGPQLLAYLLQINEWIQERGIRLEIDA